jgi:uncharacterized repeat protein (TIGR02543 family)
MPLVNHYLFTIKDFLLRSWGYKIRQLISISLTLISLSCSHPSDLGSKTYSVFYSGNGSTSGVAPSDPVKYLGNDIATVLGNTGNLVNLGYSFTGWTLDQNGTGSIYNQGSTITIGNENIDLYARWTANPTYSVSYVSNGGTSGSVPEDTAVYETNQNVLVLGNSGNLAKLDYSFAGWTLDPGGTGTVYSQGNTIMMGSANIFLYAHWINNNPSVFHGQAVDIWEDFEDSTLISGLAIEGNTTISSSDYSAAGAASCRQRRTSNDYTNVTYFPASGPNAHISAGFAFRCPALPADGDQCGIANPTDNNGWNYLFQAKITRTSGTPIFTLYTWNGNLTHSLSVGQWYWVTYRFQYSGGLATVEVNLYDFTTHDLLLDSSYSTTETSVSELTLGVETSESLSGVYLYYDDYVIDFTNYAFPLLGW